MTDCQLVLASTSPFRKTLLAKLWLPFETAEPAIDESRQPGENPERLVRRLAEQKAQAVSERFSNALVIGSDQVACLGDEILGKPGNMDRAMQQLGGMAGKTVTFYTGLCLLNARNGNTQVTCELYRVHFRPLTREQIERYLKRERPFNCAGSFKSEGLGITLFRKLEGDDPNTLIGLPLIRLVDMLGREGIALP